MTGVGRPAPRSRLGPPPRGRLAAELPPAAEERAGILRGEFFEYLVRGEAGRARRYQYFLTLLHVAFDRPDYGPASETLADLLRQEIRETDVLGRIDEDRYGILLYHADREGAGRVARRLLQRVAAHEFARTGNASRTVSVGGACFPSHAQEAQTLQRSAERMLSRAITEGGNRLRIAT